MKFNFRKVASVIASAVMLGSSAGMALAATYPAPFVVNGVGNAAIVTGSGAGANDAAAATNIQSNLNNLVTTSGSLSLSGESAPLFTSSTKIYINDSINAVRSTLTKTELPTMLKSETFSGNVEATITQSIDLGSTPKIDFGKMPTTDVDPIFALSYSTASANYLYNSTAVFNKAINFSHADSKGQELNLFGQRFTVSSATDTTKLVLLKSAEKVNLDSNNPTADVTISGSKYTIELVSASDTAATIKVTNEAGTSEQREVDEAQSKKINGLAVSVETADETNLKLSASVIAGADKVTLQDGSAVMYGEEDTTIEGTKVTITGTATVLPETATAIRVSVYAKSSDSDAIKQGTSFVDPVFGSFELAFTGLNIPETSTSREDIKIYNSGDDKMNVKFTDHRGNEKEVQYAYNVSSGAGIGLTYMQYDTDGHNITIREDRDLYRNDLVVVGNEDYGYLLKVSAITNQTTSYSNDAVRFTDVMSGDTYTATLTSEGVGSVVIGGKVYPLTYNGTYAGGEDIRSVRLDYPDSTAITDLVIYPTIETSKGARLFFYKPINGTTTIEKLQLLNHDGYGSNVTTVRLPDGDGYTDVTLANIVAENVTVDGTVIGNGTNTKKVTVGKLTYNFSKEPGNSTSIYLNNPRTGAYITDPAIVIFEEKDDNTNYEALIIDLEEGNTGTDGIGVQDVTRTWMNAVSTGSGYLHDTLASDSKKEKEADLYGSLVSIDKTDSDQTSVVISYPDEQVYANLYFAEKGSALSPESVKIVKDTDAAANKEKNLIVVGGSCINTLAAKILGVTYPACGSSSTIAQDKFLIKVVAASTVVDGASEGNVAVLVAGYEKADTEKAATRLLEGVSTDSGFSEVGPATV